MGDPVPIIPPEIDPNKWYRVSVDCFWEAVPFYSCSSPWIDYRRCCQDGAYIIWWFGVPLECEELPSEGYAMCPCEDPPLCHDGAQRVKHIWGPYDGYQDCVDDL